MCLKTIYYNTYGDGTEDVTERVDTCRPGKMCGHPEVRRVERKFRFTRLSDLAAPESPSALAERKPTPYHAEHHLGVPSPRRSKSPSPSRRDTGVFVNGTKIADTAPQSKRRSHHHREERDRPVVVPHVPEAPVVLKRSSTLPTEYVVPATERGRPRRESRRMSRDVPIGPVPVFDNLGARRRSHSRSPSPRRGVYYRKHSRGDDGYVFIDPEREDRRRRRAERRATGALPGSDFSSSTAATAATSSARNTDAVYMAGPSRTATEVRKELRWEDEVQAKIAAQNDRISRRPKLHQEVRGILKRTNTDLNGKATTTASPRKDDPYTELRRAVGRMDINTSSAPRRDEDPEYWDRLRGRFGDREREPRDGERKRRTRVYYPGEGLYKYL